MFELLQQTTEKEREKPVATAWEQRAVQKVRDMILENILEHHSIAELAKMARIDKYRLKVFFKKGFGSSLLGSNTLPVPDPIDKSSYTYVGLLCRRIQIANSRYKNLFYSFDNMQKYIMNKQLDRLTKTPGIYCKDCAFQFLPMEEK